MNGDESGNNGKDKDDNTPSIHLSQDARRPFSKENLDLALRARTIAAMTPQIQQFINEKKFLREVPLWITKPDDHVRSRYKQGHDFTALQDYFAALPENEREEALAGIDEWLVSAFAHEKRLKPYLFIAKGTDGEFFRMWTDPDPNRAPPPKTA